MANIKKWNLDIDGSTYTVTFQLGGPNGPWALKVNDEAVPIEREHHKSLIVVERPFLISKKECVFVFVGKKADIAVDGVYIDSKKPYIPSEGVPWWNWLFAAACMAIPVVSSGGFQPIVIGLLGAFFCLRASISPFLKTPLRLLACLGITAACWGLFGLSYWAMLQK